MHPEYILHSRWETFRKAAKLIRQKEVPEDTLECTFQKSAVCCLLLFVYRPFNCTDWTLQPFTGRQNKLQLTNPTWRRLQGRENILSLLFLKFNLVIKSSSTPHYHRRHVTMQHYVWRRAKVTTRATCNERSWTDLPPVVATLSLRFI